MSASLPLTNVEKMRMTQPSPIFSAKTDDQKKIGYIEASEAFDLLGNKRCNYNPNTGNLLELNSGSIVGHVSLTRYFVGVSWIADELFPQPDANAALITSPNEPTAPDYTAPAFSPDEPAAAA
jgi:hypothetical protein